MVTCITEKSTGKQLIPCLYHKYSGAKKKKTNQNTREKMDYMTGSHESKRVFRELAPVMIHTVPFNFSS